MGLIPSTCRLLIKLHTAVGFRGPLLTLGNQDVYASHVELQSIFRELGCPFVETKAVPHTSQAFRDAPPRFQEFVHARTLFEMMSISDYTDIDKFDDDSPLILHDLNLPVPAHLHDRFNLVLDSGTIEHIFDVSRVVENILVMCRTSGWVVHISPSSNFVDHGFYSLSPCFFFDVYRANGFDDFRCYLLQVDPTDYFARCPYVEYSYGMDTSDLVDPHRQLLVVFAARKVRTSRSLTVPIQGVYERNVTAGSAHEAPAPPVAGATLTPAFLRPLLRPLSPWLRPIRRRLLPGHRRLPRI